MTTSATVPARETGVSDGVDSRARRASRAAYVAIGWVLLFFAFHVYWYLGGSLASPGDLPSLVPGTHSAPAGSAHAHVQLVAWIVEVPVDAAWPVGALVCLAIARRWTLGRLARTTRVLVRIGCAVLLLRGGSGLLDDATRTTGLLPNGITGLSVQATTGHAHLRWADWTIDGYFLAGGLVFLLLALLQRAPRPRSAAPGGLATDGQAPRWAVRLAHVIPLLVLPSALWRWAVAFGFPMGMLDDSGHLDVLRGWPAVYVAFVSVLTEVVALTAFGLVQPLGQEVPRWLPVLGGRAVRSRVVLVAGTLGSVALTLIWTVGFWDVWTTGSPGRMASSTWSAVFTACYAPLNLWGPALLALTLAFRHRARGSARVAPTARTGLARPRRRVSN